MEEGGLLHLLANGFSSGCWFVDEGGRTVFANEALALMVGCTPEEMRGTGLDDFLTPEDREAVLGAIRSGAVVRGHSRPLSARRGGDRERWFRLEAVPTGGLPGGRAGAVVMLAEVTAQRRTEATSAALSSVLATSEDAIYGVDLGNAIVSWNGGAERTFGYTAEEAVGRSSDMLGPTDHPGQIEAVRELVMAGLPIENMSVEAVRKDGTRLQVVLSGTPVFDANDRVVGYTKVARDVTARRRAAEAQARLAAIVECSDDAIVSKDLNGVVLTWNPGAELVFGYAAAEMVGRSIRAIIPEDRQHEEDRILELVRGGERVDHFLTRRLRKDGSLVDVFVSASPVRDHDGRVVGISKIARDVTERLSSRRGRERGSAEPAPWAEDVRRAG